jgi:hypothetical protein
MFKVKIRGIYATALTNLLLDYRDFVGNQTSPNLLFDNDFTVVQPSATARERFEIKKNDDFPDLEVYDRQDKQGVQAFGTAGAVKAFTLILQSCLDDVVIEAGRGSSDYLERNSVRGCGVSSFIKEEVGRDSRVRNSDNKWSSLL